MTQVNEACVRDVKVDVTTFLVGSERYEISNVVEMGMACGEQTIATTRSTQSPAQYIEEPRIKRLRVPKHLSADSEFCAQALQQLL